MTTICLRCDWTADPDGEASPREQRRAHSRDTGHALCILCARSLPIEDRQTCVPCVSGVRADLLTVESLATHELPGYLGHPTGQALDADRRGGGEPALPGGDALALLAPGGTGAFGPPVDQRPEDTPSIVAVLSQWEDDWRHTLGDPAAGPATIAAAAEYLQARMNRAAADHPAFDAFAVEVRELVRTVRSVIGDADHGVPGAPCFDCGAMLERPLTRSGFADDWTCPRCRRVYDQPSYLLAIRAHLEGPAGDERLLPVPELVKAVPGALAATLRKWRQRGSLKSRGVDAAGRTLHSVSDVRALLARGTEDDAA